jgi:hypothetical protein
MIEASEQRQVLDMLKGGRIGAEDADRLLTGLAAAASDGDAQRVGGSPAPASSARHLVVVAQSEDGEVSARVPLRLIATGMDFRKLLPEAAREMVEEMGIDLSELRNVRGDELVEAIRDLEVDLDDSDGNSISIHCE